MQKSLKSRHGAINEAYIDWAKYYGEFTRKRFMKFKRGAGNWRRLKPETIKAKRRAGYTRPRWILYATALMQKSLNPRFLKSTAKIKGRGTKMQVTYGGKKRYRIKGKRGPLVAEVMKYHNEGKGCLPKRRIFINPPTSVQKKMAERMEKAMQEILNE